MFKRIAWLCALVWLLPAAASFGDTHQCEVCNMAECDMQYCEMQTCDVDDCQKRHAAQTMHAGGGIYFPPETPHRPDPDIAPNDALNRRVRILRSSNLQQVTRYVPVAYSMRNVNPFAVMRYIRRAVQTQLGSVFTFVSPDGNGGRVIMAIPEYQVESMDALIKTIDRPGLTSNDGTIRVYRQLKHRRAADPGFLAAFGIYVTGNNATIIVDPEQNAVFFEDAPSGGLYLDNALTTVLDLPTPQAVFNTKVYEVTLTNNSRIGLDFLAWKNGPGANLFAAGAFSEYGRVSLRNGNPGFLPADAGTELLSLPRSDFDTTGYNFAYRYEFQSAFFDYLAVRGKAKILNQATLAALNTFPAEIKATDQILHYPIISGDDPSGIRGSDPFAANRSRVLLGSQNKNEVISESGGRFIEENLWLDRFRNIDLRFDEFDQEDFFDKDTDIEILIHNGVHKESFKETELVPIEVGLRIFLRPIISENLVDVKINGELSDYNGFDDEGYPKINRREFDTQEVRMSEGEEILLGGLKHDTEVRSANKVPWLGSLPLVGYLFGGDNTRRIQSEIILSLELVDVVHYTDDDDYGISEGDASTIRQAEGTDAIETPDFSFGFDQYLLDKEKPPYPINLHGGGE